MSLEGGSAPVVRLTLRHLRFVAVNAVTPQLPTDRAVVTVQHAPICRWLLPATRRVEIWYRCVWVSCRYFMTASLCSVKPERVSAPALPPLPGYAKVLQLLSEFTILADIYDDVFG